MTTETKKNHGILKKFLFFLKFLEIRLRFVLILVVTALVVGYWDNIQNYVERWQRNHGAASTASKGPGGEAESEFEYYCAMHPFVVREHPGKCPICGMDLVERKKGAPQTLPEGTLARVQVSPDRIMQAGIQVEPVAYRLLTRTVRTYGDIEPDETRLARIVARFPGRIDKLMVNAVGMVVKKGEPLAQIYSPKFLAATQEYVQALKSEQRGPASADERQRAAQLTAFARQRLLLAGFTDEQLDAIKADGKLQDTVTLQSPLSGTVLEKNALLGETVAEESVLYTIADLSKVWIQALTMEADLSAVQEGMAVEVTSVAYPGEIFYGTVDFIYPTVSAENRTVKVRVVVDNASGKLKPGMYVTAVMRSPVGRYGEAEKVKAQDQQTSAAGAQADGIRPAAKQVKLPTTTEEEARAYLAGLAPGAEYYTCPMHAEVISDRAGDCPKCGMHLEKKQKEAGAGKEKAPPMKMAEGEMSGMAMAQTTVTAGMRPPGAAHGEGADQASSERWAEGWSCPMHPDELNKAPGVCTVCGCGMTLKKMRVERVPAVSENAVIDTGTRMVVYVETSPGVYDSRAVTLGPRAGEYYPVLDGLKIGERIVSRGSFLIDAEARLNPSAAAPAATGTVPPPAAEPAAGHKHGGA